MTPQFKDKAIYRLTKAEAVAYKQAVVFGVRRTRQERERMNDHAVNQGNWKLNELTRRYERIEVCIEPGQSLVFLKALGSEVGHRALSLFSASLDRWTSGASGLMADSLLAALRPAFQKSGMALPTSGGLAMEIAVYQRADFSLGLSQCDDVSASLELTLRVRANHFVLPKGKSPGVCLIHGSLIPAANKRPGCSK